MDIGKLNDTDINTQCLVDFTLWRMSKEGGGVQPQTAGNDLAHLGAVLAIAKDTWGYQVDSLAMGGARRVLRKLGYKIAMFGVTCWTRRGRSSRQSQRSAMTPKRMRFSSMRERAAKSFMAPMLASREHKFRYCYL